ncbi:hypothetical protein B0H10DRAFT_712316 [Mycena sp. CBHHK59/15]|nr:hypothetical protein B0H10DRAFT_472761 [Mycena sp. CBHHK59/15]KAJ6631201.1 hypothetical protein B0H10DRAFT_712316 [Mycena sp. CBHHK59/15]
MDPICRTTRSRSTIHCILFPPGIVRCGSKRVQVFLSSFQNCSRSQRLLLNFQPFVVVMMLHLKLRSAGVD